MHCRICGKYIFGDAHYINGDYFHNTCIIKLVEEKEKKENESNKK